MKIGTMCHYECCSGGNKVTQTENLGLYKGEVLEKENTQLK